MSLENLDVKDVYVIGENLKCKLGEQLGTQFSGQKLVSWLLEHDGLVRVLCKSKNQRLSLTNSILDISGVKKAVPKVKVNNTVG